MQIMIELLVVILVLVCIVQFVFLLSHKATRDHEIGYIKHIEKELERLKKSITDNE